MGTQACIASGKPGALGGKYSLFLAKKNFWTLWWHRVATFTFSFTFLSCAGRWKITREMDRVYVYHEDLPRGDFFQHPFFF
jgi:hypothetical protein